MIVTLCNNVDASLRNKKGIENHIKGESEVQFLNASREK